MIEFAQTINFKRYSDATPHAAVSVLSSSNQRVSRSFFLLSVVNLAVYYSRNAALSLPMLCRDRQNSIQTVPETCADQAPRKS
jgi:hypothetical protein